MDPLVILNPGHRHRSGGNSEERTLTPLLAEAYLDALTAAGIRTVNLGDTGGPRGDVCRRIVSHIEQHPGQCIVLDLHLENGSATTPGGVFCIVPNNIGLRAGAGIAQSPDDTWNANVMDRRLGSSLVAKIACATGLAIRAGREPGLISETRTGIGSAGRRLSVFAHTSRFRHRAVRLIVEHGNLSQPTDRAIINSKEFPVQCGRAAVEAIRTLSWRVAS